MTLTQSSSPQILLGTLASSLTATFLLITKSPLSVNPQTGTSTTSGVSIPLFNTTKTIATSLVHSKLDYCNSLYLNLPAYQLARLQCVQNSLARVVCRIPKHHHITPSLRSLHWLKIPQRIHYKLLSTTFTLIQHQQPSYLYSQINIQSARSTRSSSLLTLSRPPVSTAKLSDRSFHHFIPRLWETLPPSLRLLNTPSTGSSVQPPLAISRSQFLSRLKTHLFKQSYPP